jgi:hypothetical protein
VISLGSSKSPNSSSSSSSCCDVLRFEGDCHMRKPASRERKEKASYAWKCARENMQNMVLVYTVVAEVAEIQTCHTCAGMVAAGCIVDTT